MIDADFLHRSSKAVEVAPKLPAVYHKVREDLEKLGMIFTDMDTALRLYPDIIKEEQTFQQERRLTVVPLLTLI